MADAMRSAPVIATNMCSIKHIHDGLVPLLEENYQAISMVHSPSGTKLRRTVWIRHQYVQQAVVDALIDIHNIQINRPKAHITTTALVLVPFTKTGTHLVMDSSHSVPKADSGFLFGLTEGETAWSGFTFALLRVAQLTRVYIVLYPYCGTNTSETQRLFMISWYALVYRGLRYNGMRARGFQNRV